MKKLILVLSLLLTNIAYSQVDMKVVSYGNYVDVNLVDTDKDTIYFLYPEVGGRWYASTTLPTRYYTGTRERQFNYSIEGDIYLHTELNLGSGLIAAETDSLAHWIKWLTWKPKDLTFDIIDGDSTFIKFDGIDEYIVSTIDYLDWTAGIPYGTLLTGATMPVSGFVLIRRQLLQDAGEAGTSVGTYWCSFLREIKY